MKKNKTENNKSKSLTALTVEMVSLRGEIEKLQIEKKVNPVKDTNSIAKKKKMLAQILTTINEKKLIDKL